jgi:hypothetical protein
VEWHLHGVDLEIEFDRDGKGTYWYHDEETGNEVEEAFDDAAALARAASLFAVLEARAL